MKSVEAEAEAEAEIASLASMEIDVKCERKKLQQKREPGYSYLLCLTQREL